VRACGAAHEHWCVDLAEPAAVAARLEAWIAQRRTTADGGATLVNNAGVLGPVGPVDAGSPEAIAAALRIDLEAPILLTRAFLRATSDANGPRRIVQVSSGAGRNAYAGWSIYGAAKAGLDHFARAVALDEAQRRNPARIVSLAPGVIDTAMQAELRDSDPAGFPELPRFLALHAKGQLTTPEAAATRLLAFLDRPDFGAKPVADARDA